MKKTNNKGFSLVELIIVIAIMAILAGAIAPALIRYIDKSRKSNDVTSCKSIKTAIETALGNDDVYAYLTSNEDELTVITINPGVKTATPAAAGSAGDDKAAIEITGVSTDGTFTVGSENIDAFTKTEIGTNIGEKTPKVKYKKANKAKETTCKDVPAGFYAVINQKGTVFVMIAADAPTTDPTDEDVSTYPDGYLICPESCAAYQ